jgi:Tfp pilus assembly protein PilE
MKQTDNSVLPKFSLNVKPSMEILNRNQRVSALWRLTGLYAATVVIIGIIAFQSLKSYRNRLEAQHQQDLKAAVDKEKKNCEATVEAKVIAAFREATGSIVKDAKPTPAPPATNSSGTNVQGNLNTVNNGLMQAKGVQTTVKSIGAMATDLNPLKK